MMLSMSFYSSIIQIYYLFFLTDIHKILRNYLFSFIENFIMNKINIIYFFVIV